MAISFHRLLTCLLAFALALAPMQPVWAVTDTSPPASLESCHDSAKSMAPLGAVPDHVGGASMACDHCGDGESCADNGCAFGLCASASAALLLLNSSIDRYVVDTHLTVIACTIPLHTTYGPYRPPRV